MKHDEAKDVRLLSRIAKINSAQKTITIPDYQIIGNKRWGRLDFLCHYCGYRIIRPSGEIITPDNKVEKKNKRNKKEEKEKISKKRKQAKFARQ